MTILPSACNAVICGLKLHLLSLL